MQVGLVSASSSMTLEELVAQLKVAPRCDPATLRPENIPKAPGIYVWYTEVNEVPMSVRPLVAMDSGTVFADSTSIRAISKGAQSRSQLPTRFSSAVQS